MVARGGALSTQPQRAIAYELTETSGPDVGMLIEVYPQPDSGYATLWQGSTDPLDIDVTCHALKLGHGDQAGMMLVVEVAV